MRPFVLAALAGLLLAPSAIAQDSAIEDVNNQLGDLAEEARVALENLTFEEFRDQTLYVEETGKYYVNGDTPIRNEKLLREFWAQHVAQPSAPADPVLPELAVMNIGGIDQIWSNSMKRALTYCVSTAFGGRHALVVADMQAAAAAWEAVADLDFHYIQGEDGNCHNGNTNVVFDVRPVNAGGRFLAAAFFPNDPRAKRSVVIDPSSFALDPNGALTLRGILRHELGHAIGGRHEHTRPEAGACFEDTNWRGVTNYDAFSVMHYPQCNGRGDWTLRLTAADKSGIACIYGAAAGFTIDTSICRPTGVGSGPVTLDFGPFEMRRDDIEMIGQFNVVPGSQFSVQMVGEGDPDLYVKINGDPGFADYDCRPYTEGADEECTFDVTPGATFVSVMVHGWSDATALLTVTHQAP